ncbi:DUF3394 domain-containing protein, partial [Salmonella enterica subsp. enterica]|nr:DUF3394 domain-containing protein [Salmonella enterica subsp. enterica]
SPSLLLVTKDFNWPDFFLAFFGCAFGIVCLGAALSRYMLVRTRAWENVLLIVAAFLMIAPEIYSTLIGVALVVPVLINQWRQHQAESLAAA